MRVLVVDDENDICLMVSRILKAQGIECDYAHSIKQAEIKTNINEYNLFIVDINLSDGTGLDLIPSLKEANSKANIITISAQDDSDIVDKALRLGADKFIKKPFTKAEILDLV